jgi:hypothetical protein
MAITLSTLILEGWFGKSQLVVPVTRPFSRMPRQTTEFRGARPDLCDASVGGADGAGNSIPFLGLGPAGSFGPEGPSPRPINPTYIDMRFTGPLPPVPQSGQRIKPTQVAGFWWICHRPLKAIGVRDRINGVVYDQNSYQSLSTRVLNPASLGEVQKEKAHVILRKNKT